MKKLVTLKMINLKTNPEFDEKWLQKVISENPAIIGLGDVNLIGNERSQPGAGRLDLLLQDAEHARYEVEIQLGATDESHIIRTIEYWDIERRRYPQYDHTAVLIAEDVTSRFLNVIGLFNGVIPIMAMQVTAIETSDGIGLLFTKILDTVNLGYIGDDEETSEPTDRAYWINKGSEKTVLLADNILDIAKTFAPSATFSYNKFYMGFWVNDRACNFAVCRPQRKALRLEIRLPQTEETNEFISEADLPLLGYDKNWRHYKMTISEKDLPEKSETLRVLMKQSYERMR